MNEEMPRNHGLPWHSGDLLVLKNRHLQGDTIERLARDFGRTTISIECKLRALGLIDAEGRPIERPDDAIAALKYAFQQPTQPKEQPMLFTLKVQSKTFINDTEVSTMTEEDFFNVIYRAEQEIERLDKIEHKPKAIQVKKDELIESIMVVVNLLDARTCLEPK